MPILLVTSLCSRLRRSFRGSFLLPRNDFTHDGNNNGQFTDRVILEFPFVCNWVQGAEYCGRRFSNSEDLMGHLRSHTSGAAASASSNATLAMLQAAQAQALMPPNPHVSTSALAMLQAQASKVAACITKTSSASERHHPYSRPNGVVPPSVGLPGGLGSLPPGFPPHLAAAMFPNPFVPSGMGGGPPPGMIPYPHLLYPKQIGSLQRPATMSELSMLNLFSLFAKEEHYEDQWKRACARAMSMTCTPVVTRHRSSFLSIGAIPKGKTNDVGHTFNPSKQRRSRENVLFV
ncbi:hypothetical protein TCAL_17434 [Tigriopus californicus]|uniref:C2H2-type domain-containing protein n=1 Tax=Tigriopus californicus TaxID=6832 RepID=A0A553NCY1_TIGCA|nr:hypothetical protein TCAL_17434 [Tigriopus californicus]